MPVSERFATIPDHRGKFENAISQITSNINREDDNLLVLPFFEAIYDKGSPPVRIVGLGP